MDTNSTGAAATPTPGPSGLPPVRPPQASAFVQLFIVPALILLALIGLFLAGPALSQALDWLLGRPPDDARSAERYLRDLDNSNPEVRWRAAADLAQVLLRNDEIARSPHFALTLAERADSTLNASLADEKAFAKHEGTLPADDPARKRAEVKLQPERDYLLFLTSALGNCSLPTGVPILFRLASDKETIDPETRLMRRRRAVFALATLGQNLKRFDALSEDEKNRILAELDAHPASSLARETHGYLEARSQGKATTMGVARVLEECADDDDEFLRLSAAFASNFWEGTPAENAAMEATLVKLSRDDGRGEETLEEQLARNPDAKQSRVIAKRKGLLVQVNATLALARRGSDKVRMPLLVEMLDEPTLSSLFRLQAKNAPETPALDMVAETIENTLRAVVLLHQKRPGLDLSPLIPAIQKLTENSNARIRNEANQAKIALSAPGN
jgi:hypothetical protein